MGKASRRDIDSIISWMNSEGGHQPVTSSEIHERLEAEGYSNSFEDLEKDLEALVGRRDIHAVGRNRLGEVYYIPSVGREYRSGFRDSRGRFVKEWWDRPADFQELEGEIL